MYITLQIYEKILSKIDLNVIYYIFYIYTNVGRWAIVIMQLIKIYKIIYSAISN